MRQRRFRYFSDEASALGRPIAERAAEAVRRESMAAHAAQQHQKPDPHCPACFGLRQAG